MSPKRSVVFDEKSLAKKQEHFSLTIFLNSKKGPHKKSSLVFFSSSSSLEQNAVLYSRFREEDE